MPKIIHIRSLTPGSIPTISSLGVGEIAINVPDGKAFLRQSGSQGDTIQSFVTTNSTTSGSITISGSVTITGSLTVTSGITGSLYGTSSWSVNSQTASFATNAFNTIVLTQNKSGANIGLGVVVRITGSANSGDTPYIVTASYQSDAFSANTLGITYQAINNNNTGYVITQGILTGLDTSQFYEGQLLYLGATGSIIGTAPTAPLHAVRLGEVIRQHANDGAIYVRIDNGYELGELHNVNDTSNGNSYGDLLIKSGSVWINSKILSGSYTLSGSLNTNDGITAVTVNAISVTASLFGTASYTIQALSASYALNANTASYSINASTASFLPIGTYNITSSWAEQAVTASYVLNAVSSSFASTALSAPLYVLTASTSSMTVALANTASYITSSNVYGPFGANSILSASFALSASWAPGGSGAGFPFNGNAEITGSLLVSSSLLVTGSLAVTGSTSLNYTNTQTYKIDSTTAGPTTLATITTGSNTSAFVNYTINKAANARAGQLIAVWYGTSSQYTDVSTLDIGDTTEFAFTASIVSSNLQISENATSGWSVKMLVNLV